LLSAKSPVYKGLVEGVDDMKIGDLKKAVTAAKSNWTPTGSWMGFTPENGDLYSRNSCQSTIQRQFGDGYVLEYITGQYGEPNKGFEDHPRYLEHKAQHGEVAGKLLAIHRLYTTSKPLEKMIPADEFETLQDMWAEGGKRHRWAVAFPVVETYKIVEQPVASEVFGNRFRHFAGHPSATLRPLKDEDRALLSMLKIERVATANAWIAMDDEFVKAEGSQIDPRIDRSIEDDLRQNALEGFTEEVKGKIKRRAKWLADLFVRKRQRSKTLFCDDCGFDPVQAIDCSVVKPRSLLDVHHLHPLEEGVRITSIEDFALLCPTCHRVEHARLRANLPKRAMETQTGGSPTRKELSLI
jgi:5-methylcytosine-specific restriction protein A